MKLVESFPQILDDNKLLSVFQDTELLKIVVMQNTNTANVYIQNETLIHRRDIKALEKKLNLSLFPREDGSLKIVEQYLFEEKTAEEIFRAYESSFLEEISDKGNVFRTVYLSSKVKAEGDKLYLTIKDSNLDRHYGGLLRNYFLNTYKERFGRDVIVELEFVKPEAKTKTTEVVESATNESWASPNEIYDYSAETTYVEMKNNEKQAKDTSAVDKENNTSPVQEQKSVTPAKDSNTVQPKKTAYDKVKFKKKKLPEDPDIFFGRPFEGSCIPISEIQDEIGDVVIQGKVLGFEDRELKIEKHLFTFSITDFTDTIKVKLFLKEEQLEEVTPNIEKGAFVRLKGVATFDKFDHEISIGSVLGIKKIKDFTVKRKDTAQMKRVELHAHTKMSDMDAVVPPADLVKTAFNWGHRAVAITDHGVVQGFTEANHALDKKKFKDDPEKLKQFEEFKIIYGMEAYLVDDIKELTVNCEGIPVNTSYTAISITTSGSAIEKDSILEYAAVKLNGENKEFFHTYVDAGVVVSEDVTKHSGLRQDHLMNAPQPEAALSMFLQFIQDSVLLAFQPQEEIGFITQAAKRAHLLFEPAYVDIENLCRMLYPDFQSYRIGAIAKELQLKGDTKGANAEAECCLDIYNASRKLIYEKNINSLDELNGLGRMSDKAIKSMPMYHAVILCQNDIGRVNLYRLVSYSHIDYYQKRPRIPKSVFLQNREGLLIGSACEAGELYRALVFQRPEAEIRRLAKFYDYYEIQPLGNNEFMINDDDYYVKSFDDLKDLNRKIVALGEEYNKPVVATCDVHFLNPEDEIYRRIIMAGQGFKDADHQAPLYLHTTDEMLEEFSYLGPDKAFEVVVTNTNLIADKIEKISPVRPDKCPPVIENSDVKLRTICYEKAHSMYGDPLPEIVKTRLDHELNSIIKNGFAVMYIIAQELVWKSNADGYLVGSRGSVGSSFVATMAGITEVNPLPPHYYCKKCQYSDFDSETIKANASISGFDLPDAVCPVCGERLTKDGNNIPFETFLGFNGDKEPDIDLNFSGEYQSKAHDYTEVLFGKGHTFRAGTITGLADKTAYGYVMKYFEERGVPKRSAEIERIAKGCEGVRKSTGQHPGGIIVLPHGEEIYSFTPVQRPANDMTTTTVTTHFDYHSIDHNLLKLDILGHDDPTMIRMLQDITGLDAKDIPMDDKKVVSLFASTEALGITPEDIDGCPLGSLGLPELGTPFVIQMLLDTKPTSFTDMICISGLSHGTDVWLGNAQTLIQENKCTLSSAVCTRDEIMVYLISKNIESGTAFKIMESVRKGKGLSEEWEQLMIDHDVPDWYIWSCKKIKYMFPKAHACAYVMMAFRIAYFKVYYPQAYYAAYFSIRAKAMDYATMCRGKDILVNEMKQLKARANSKDPANKLSKKEEDSLDDMKIVLEMYARGIECQPIDIFKAKATRFQVIGDKIMPSLNSINGLGDKAAEQIEEAVKDGPFLSREDFRIRCKVSQTITDTMAQLGLLGDLPESNQMSILDLLK